VGWHVHENLGRRIAELRAKLSLTQQELADRLGVSRVAVSHLEAGMSTPGERTVALLASVFKLEPHELVAGTDYPAAKADRLPVVVARYTNVELELVMLDNDLVWLAAADDAFAEQVLARWEAKLGFLADTSHDRRELAAIAEARQTIRRLRADRTQRS
jgi:transcriptional regulator with XRE-family HTH domain